MIIIATQIESTRSEALESTDKAHEKGANRGPGILGQLGPRL